MKIRFLLLILYFVLPMIRIRAEKTELFVCDLDLVSEEGQTYFEPWKPSFLSSQCQSIYAKRATDPKGYEMYRNEANAFREFVAALEQYEVKQSGKALCEDTKYPFVPGDRSNFYKQVNLCECYKKNNKESFLHCLVERRKKLVNIINAARDRL